MNPYITAVIKKKNRDRCFSWDLMVILWTDHEESASRRVQLLNLVSQAAPEVTASVTVVIRTGYR